MSIVIFRKPIPVSEIEFSHDARGYRFPFTVREAHFTGSPLVEEPRHGSLTVTISMELQCNWGLQQVAEPDLAKLLFAFAKERVRENIQTGTLKERDEFALLITTHPGHCPYESAELEEPEGARLEVGENPLSF